MPMLLMLGMGAPRCEINQGRAVFLLGQMASCRCTPGQKMRTIGTTRRQARPGPPCNEACVGKGMLCLLLRIDTGHCANFCCAVLAMVFVSAIQQQGWRSHTIGFVKRTVRGTIDGNDIMIHGFVRCCLRSFLVLIAGRWRPDGQ